MWTRVVLGFYYAVVLVLVAAIVVGIAVPVLQVFAGGVLGTLALTFPRAFTS